MFYTKQTLAKIVALCWKKTFTCLTTRGHNETECEVELTTTYPPISLKQLWQQKGWRWGQNYFLSLKGQTELGSCSVSAYCMFFGVLISDISLQIETNFIFEPLERVICGILHQRLISRWQHCLLLMSQWADIHSQQWGTPLHIEMYKKNLLEL